MVGGLTCLVFEAAAHAPLRASFHPNPLEVFKHFEGTCSTEMVGGISVTCVHDTRSSQQRYIDAGGGIEGKPASAGRGPPGPEAKTMELRTRSALLSPWRKGHLAARSRRPAESGRWSEGVWS